MGGADEAAARQADGRERRDLSPNAIHLLRTTQQIHVALSQMADQKASILMGATFVIFTITVGQMRSGQMPPLALLILGLFAFFAAVLAVLAILPATQPKGQAGAAPANLLFFGSFAQIDEDEYVRRLVDLLHDDDTIHAMIARDLYQNGRVLARKKYRLLGAAYRVFLIGLTASFLAAGGEYLLHRASAPAAASAQR